MTIKAGSYDNSNNREMKKMATEPNSKSVANQQPHLLEEMVQHFDKVDENFYELELSN
jgi:hypothetical protein